MGLIKAAVGAVGSTLHDQWKDYIKCDDLGQDILMKRVSTPNGIISKDSAIQVSPGQLQRKEFILLINLLHQLFLQANLVQYLKKCGLVLYIMELQVKNKQYFT